MDYQFVKKRILVKLVNLRMFGGKHTEIKNLAKGFPDNFLLNKENQKLLQKVIKDLMSEEILLAKKSTGEINVSLNPRKISEIKKFIEDGFS